MIVRRLTAPKHTLTGIIGPPRVNSVGLCNEPLSSPTLHEMEFSHIDISLLDALHTVCSPSPPLNCIRLVSGPNGASTTV